MSYQDPTTEEVNAPLLAYPESFKWTTTTVSITFAQNITEVRTINNEPPSMPDGRPFEAIEPNDPIRAGVFEISKIWSDYINLTFVEGTDHSPNVDGIHVAKYTQPDARLGYANPPPLGNLFISSGNQNFNVTGKSHYVVLHEFGHVLGLRHAGDYNHNDDVKEPSSYQDSLVYSVMSYFGPGMDDPTNGAPVQGAVWHDGYNQYFPQTAMMNDIRALQERYGAANETTRDGNTVYGFNTGASLDAAEKKIYDFDNNQHPVLCIYDAGGVDTLDLSGFTTRSAISLIPGTFSNAAGMTMNISIAYGTIIEKAVGGGAADIILGNDEDNVLIGNGGDDIIYGGRGSDTLRGGHGDDTLVGYFGGVSLTANAGTPPFMTEQQMQLWNAHVKPDDASEIDVADYSDVDENNVMTTGIVVDMRAASKQVLSDGFGTSDTLIGIEKILGTKRDDAVYLAGDTRFFVGGAGNDTAYGATARNDFEGGEDNDIFYHMSGKSTFAGGNGNDTLDLTYASGSFRFDFKSAQVYRAANGGWSSESDITFSSVESIFGSSGDDTFVFDDAFSSLPSTSKFDGKGGNNTMDFSERENGIQLQRMNATTLKTADGKTLTNFQKFVGTDKADSLVLLNGMKEVDGGDNVGGVDTLDIRGYTGGIATYYVETQAIVASGSGLVATGFENILYNSNQLRIMGTDNPENFVGTSAVDWIYGQGGNDIFQLSAGNDNLWGGDGNDTFYANIGDTIDGGADYNTLHVTYNGQLDTQRFATFTNIDEFHITNAEVFANFTSRPNLELYFYGDRIQHIGFTNGVGYKHIETGAWDDKVNAWGEGHYDGGTGIDTINLRAMGHWGLTIDKAAKTVTWDNGTKSLEYVSFEKVEWGTGQNGVTVLGNDQAERFFQGVDKTRKEIYDGRGGNDTLIADNGGDELTGGSGNDTFVFNDWGSTTIVRDFNHSEDNLVLTWTPAWAFRQEVHGDDIHLWGNNSKFAILEGAAAGGNVTYTVKSITSILNSTSGLETNAVAPSDDWMLVA